MLHYLDYVLLVIIIISLIILLRLSSAEKIGFSSPSTERMVSIIIPARNESQNIKECLDSLTELNYSNYELILVDGDSSDNTREIANTYDMVKIIPEPEKPDKWMGKSWACHIGQKEAEGEILLFTDADTIHHPNSLATMVDQLDKSEGFVTLVTTQRLQSFWEKLLIIVFFVGIVSLGGLRQTEKYGFANGQYMMFERTLYNTIGDQGGFAEVKSSVVDDFALATLLTELGIDIRIVSKLHLVEARMYRNFSEIVRGFTKNLGTGANAIGWNGFLRANIVQAWGILAFVYIPIGLTLVEPGAIDVTYAGIVGYMLFASIITLVEKSATGKISYASIIYPIYLLIYQYIVMRSIIYTNLKGEIEWKGRKYSIEVQ